MVDFLMPESDKDRGENPIVDSLAVASDWTIVSKCALHGLIYVFDLKVNIVINLMINIEVCFSPLKSIFTSYVIISISLDNYQRY